MLRDEMVNKISTETILTGIREGDKRCASLLMSLIEDGRREGEECLRNLYTQSGRSYVLGITGWPGVGKSTLINRMVRSFLAEDKQVGIIAIDPTSPFSGGSLLGDRERMKEIDGDFRLFIRSAATRGHTGGITRTTKAFVKIMEAMGKEVILLETVGIGQNEVSVAQVADTIVLIVIPGMGDYLQTLKAGVLEIGDIFVVNKSDREGANQTAADLKMFIELNRYQGTWKPPIIKTVATDHQGIEELMAAIQSHREYLTRCNLILSKRESAIKFEILEILKSRFLKRIAEKTPLDERLNKYAQQICNGSMDPFSAAEEILKDSGVMR
jgi:LAO/AO transport system kinase